MVFTDTLAKMSQSFSAYSFKFLAFLFWEKNVHFLEDASAKNEFFFSCSFSSFSSWRMWGCIWRSITKIHKLHQSKMFFPVRGRRGGGEQKYFWILFFFVINTLLVELNFILCIRTPTPTFMHFACVWGFLPLK